MKTQLLKDSNGKTSTTRVLLYIWDAFIMVLSCFSIYTGNDIGSNMSEILQMTTLAINGGGFCKMGAEALKK